MQLKLKHAGGDWPKALWKILRNPALEVIAAIVLVMFATWVVVQTEAEHRTNTPFPVPVAPK